MTYASLGNLLGLSVTKNTTMSDIAHYHKIVISLRETIRLMAEIDQVIETLPENDRTRYTITPQARKELLTRLLELNHHRAEEEATTQVTKATKGINRKKPQRAKNEDELL